MSPETTRWLRITWPIGLSLIGIAASFAGFDLVMYAVLVILFGRLLWLIPSGRRAKRDFDESVVEFADHVLDRGLEQHQPTGSYEQFCQTCGPGVAWPCAPYLHASTVRGESPKAKRKWLLS